MVFTMPQYVTMLATIFCCHHVLGLIDDLVTLWLIRRRK